MKTIKLLLSTCIGMLMLSGISQTFEIYVSDAGNYTSPPWQVAKFDGSGDDPQTFNEDDVIWPQDIVFLEDQEVVLVSSLTANGYISKHNITTGTFVGYFAENINGPTRMKIGSDNLLYVLQWYNGNNKVLRYQLDGTFVDEFTSVGIPQSIGIDWDSEGNLYISSYTQDLVQKFDSDGNFVDTFINSDLAGPTNIWFDNSGDLMVIDYDGGAVKRFNPDGDFMSVFIPGLSYPEGIAFFPNGNMLIGNGGTHSVKLFDPDGNFIEDFIPSGSGELITPNAVVIRETTSVFISENIMTENVIVPSSGNIFRINPDVAGRINSIAIFDLTGSKVAEMDQVNKDWVWQANNAKPGIYLISCKSQKGGVKVEKVVVREK